MYVYVYCTYTVLVLYYLRVILVRSYCTRVQISVLLYSYCNTVASAYNAAELLLLPLQAPPLKNFVKDERDLRTRCHNLHFA
jgi:hypothetical protein